VWRVKLFRQLGANPTPMPYSEVFMALQTGVMDGQENPLAQIYSGKFQEVQTYLSLTGHVYTPAFLTAGASWRRLPEDVRVAIVQVARDLQPFVHETAARMDDDVLEALRRAGMMVNEADRDRFRTASEPIYVEFGRSVEGGSALIQKALALADS